MSALADRILGGWLGRISGNMLGKPVERGDYWTRERIDRYLRETGALPLTDYLPPPPSDRLAEYALRPEWPECVRGRIHGSCRDDDVDYSILGLHLLETYGFGFTTDQVGELWLLRLPYLQTFTAERATYRNLAAGLKPPVCATVDNPYQEWIGALIRADVFGWVCPGDPGRAAALARRDAVLSHTGNGVYAAMWAAALVAAAFTADGPRAAVGTALDRIPPGCRLARTVRRTVSLYEAGLSWAETLTELDSEARRLHWIHAVPNAAVITAGLLYGEGDFTATIALTVRGGLDTDSNGATAGSVAGVLCGAGAIPPQWTEPLADRVRSAVYGFDGARISDLAARTERLAVAGGA
ncbi:ADP-ribosylglycohydrolase family protein [Streptomyces sp. P1-3]|uniref:ADP-ribosylglycohydrolase family protein n=1 Tax=Streptomyces sp. P1-3 TaxID=3421658 RepID=UPI003D3666AC